MDFNSYNVLVKFPIRERKEKLITRLHELAGNIALPNTKILLTIDKDDKVLYNRNTISEIQNICEEILADRVFIHFCDPKGKIHAVNAGLDEYSEPWDCVIVYSDDMSIATYGFDRQVAIDMMNYFPNTDGAMWYSDGYTHHRICTYPVLGREYYKRFGYIYNPEYKSLFCDNEQTEVCQKLGLIHYQNFALFYHDHPANVGGEVDELLVKNEGFWKEDELTYKRRKENNFYL